MIRNCRAAFAFACSCAFLAFSAGGVREARAFGFVRFDSTGFLRSAQDRADSVSTVVLGPEYADEGRWLSTALDLKGIAYLSDRSSFTVEAGNAYIATSPQWMPHHQISLGRRIYEWSAAEEAWGMGLWSARFMWNPLNPERIGLTGAFYSYESSSWRLLAFATPISPPERGFPIRDDTGKLTSPSPDWIPPYDQLLVMNQAIDIRYSIAYPPMQELLFRPGAAVALKYGKELGPWMSGAYGIMPMHQVQLGVEAWLLPSGSVEATIHPQTLFHHLATIEAGYRAPLWGVWGSISGEAPIQKDTPADWMTDPMGPALILSGGGDIKLDRAFTLSASYLLVEEDKPAPPADQIPIDFQQRFPFTRAFQLEGKWSGVPRLTPDVHWIYDVADQSHLVSLDLLYEITRRRARPEGPLTGWVLGLGADLITTSTGKGLIGQYDGNDRLRGRVSYAF